MRSRKSWIGHKFGDYTVEYLIETRKYSKGYLDYYGCRCKCGHVAKITCSDFKVRSSCKNCYGKRLSKIRQGSDNPAYRHGLSKRFSRLMNNYSKMHDRCENSEAHNYADYGGRGIKVCKRWSGKDGFLHFFQDMGERPSDFHSIDRINVNGNYEPNNCRWADPITQANNKRPRKEFR